MAPFKPSPPSDYDSLTPSQRLKHAVSLFSSPEYTYHDSAVMRLLQIVSATISPHPRATFHLRVPSTLTQPLGSLHGGATALIFDVCTTLAIALVHKEGWWEMLGVSRTLNVSYLGAVREGEEVEVEAEIVGMGKRMCLIRGVMWKVGKEGGGKGEIVATCEHGKVNVDARVKL